MDKSSLPDGPSIVKRLLQSIENEVRPGRARHAPADDAPGEDVDHERDAEILPDAAGGSGHACALETALMMHVIPDSVRDELIPAGTMPPSWPDPHLCAGPAVTVWRPFEAIRENGVIGTPSDATPEAGARI